MACSSYPYSQRGGRDDEVVVAIINPSTLGLARIIFSLAEEIL